MRVISLIRTIGIITYLSLFLKQINFDTNTFAFHICFEVKGEQIINIETGETDVSVKILFLLSAIMVLRSKANYIRF